MSNIRFGDSPSLVSLSHLDKLDKAPSGTYFASAKLDGRRRHALYDGHTWHYIAKNRQDSEPLPEHLRTALESIEWPPICLDLEWTGLRQLGDEGSLYIFDVLMSEGLWVQAPFSQRLSALQCWKAQIHPLIRVAQYVSNPSMTDLFQMQLQEPLSEGIVIRHKDQVNRGSFEKSVENPLMWKCKFSRVKDSLKGKP